MRFAFKPFYRVFSLFPLLDLAAGHASVASIDVIPSRPSSGPSVAQFTSESTLFDAPKVKKLNDTAADWWYFDVVSSDQDYTLVITFFAATPDSLWSPTPDLGTSTYMLFVLTMPDGTILDTNVLGEDLAVVTIENGSSGVLGNTSNIWTSSPDMSQYNIFIDIPDLAVSGNVSLPSIAPAHFPCAPATAPCGQRLNLDPTPGFGWVNAVPDANATVYLNINGTIVQFSGPGYHDQNWSSQPVHTTTDAWYWGHARLGPFSFVWFDVISPNGTELVSTYLAQEGHIISSTCGNATVRPLGANAVFPPTTNSSMVEPPGFNITASIEGEGTLTMQIAHTQLILAAPGLAWRWTGNVTGGFGNGTVLQGIAVYEQFTFDNSQA